MPFNTFTVACSTTPTVIGTFFGHYTTSKRKRVLHPAKEQLSYEEGVNLIGRFLSHPPCPCLVYELQVLMVEHASHHKVEELQTFTSGYIPVPSWVHHETPTIPAADINKAAEILTTYLGADGIAQIGGPKWWKWRAKELKGEWIEMKSHYHKRLRDPTSVPKRTLLYVHGGAYFFNSVATERYQIQRHARKLNCRAFAPRYRLAPQYPFPCAMLDVLSAYVYLLDTCGIPGNEILISGDSAGAGLVLGLLCLLRDVGLPLPAGAMLISPWVDLMHSFPSIVEESGSDYIPNWGFHHRPSLAWPPPTVDDLERLRANWPAGSQTHLPNIEALAEQTVPEAMGYKVVNASTGELGKKGQASEMPRVEIDGKIIEVKDQIQMLAPNEMLDNPLISPVTQASLGGLCPLLIVTGGGELLRDEQIYIAHKAANPSKYPTADLHLNKYPSQKANVDKYPGTQVYLQVFDDCAHVTPTLSFTRPAKYMYRSIANFGTWATTAETKPLQRRTSTASTAASLTSTTHPSGVKIRITGTLPPFVENMIRHRVSTHGAIRPMEHPSEIPSLQLPPNQICIIHPGPTKRWLTAKQKWDTKYAKQKRGVQLARGREYIEAQRRGFLGGELRGEMPPPSALAGRPSVQMAMEGSMVEKRERERKRNFVGWMWNFMGGMEDKEKEEVKIEGVGTKDEESGEDRVAEQG